MADALAEGLSGGSVDRRREAAHARCGDARPEDVPLLKTYLDEEIGRQDVERVRQRRFAIVEFDHIPVVLKTLHDLGAPPEREILKALLNSPTHDLGTGALEYIHQRERRDLIPEVEGALKHRGEHARLEAMRTFIDLGEDAEALSQALRALKAPLTPTSGFIWKALAERGVVDVLEVLECLEPGTPGFRPYVPEIVSLLGVKRAHGLVSRDYVRGRLLALEEELQRADPGFQSLRMFYDDRWLSVLQGLGEVGDRDAAGDLARRMARAPDARSWMALAEAFADPAWLPRLTAPPSDQPGMLGLRARCGDADSRARFLEVASREPRHPDIWRPGNAALIPPDRRTALWRSAFQSTGSTAGRRAVIGFARDGFSEILRNIADDPQEHPLVRAEARRMRSLPSPEAPPRLVRFTSAQVDKLRKKWRNA